jgi:hypothetical protein
MSLSAARLSLDLGQQGRLRLLYASPDWPLPNNGHSRGAGIDLSIVREVLDGLAALASYPSARTRRRLLVNGSAFSARLRAPRLPLEKLEVHEMSPHNNAGISLYARDTDITVCDRPPSLCR